MRNIVLVVLASFCACTLGLSLFPPRISSARAAPAEGARRVIVFPPVLAAYATIDEGCDHIAGASALGAEEQVSHDPLYAANPCLNEVAPMATLPRGTTFPSDPEQVLLRDPDAVLTWPGAAPGLEAVGLPLVNVRSLNASGGAVESWRLLGTLAGKLPRAEQLLRTTEAEDARVLRAVEQFTGTRPRFLLMWNLEDSKTFFLGPPFYGPALDLGNLHGINLAPQHQVGRADVEELFVLDPDVIFLTRQNPELFYRQPQLSPLRAVRERKIYRVPAFGGRLERLVPDHALYLSWAAELLYPEQMTNDTRSRLRNLYRLDEATLDRALFLDENGLSAHYERFRGPATR
ncbi:MAG: ABC transporter substrate-binding protein [Gammaproteobacteria bacterium]